MPGNKIGGLKAAATNKRLYGKDHFKKIGRIGGAAGHSGGFASPNKGKDGLTGRQRAKIAGAIGGRASKLESFILLDEAPFDDGFNQPGVWARFKDRLF